MIMWYYRIWLDENAVPIAMDELQCNEDNDNIKDCSARFISHECDHSDDLWLQCKGNMTDDTR